MPVNLLTILHCEGILLIIHSLSFSKNLFKIILYISLIESSANKQRFSTGSDKTLSNDNVIKSISGGVVTASDSSNEPYHPIPTGTTVASMTTTDKVSEPERLTVMPSSSSSPKLNNPINVKEKLEVGRFFSSE